MPCIMKGRSRKGQKHKGTTGVAVVFLGNCVVIILSCCSVIVLGHGIQYPLGASQRDVLYETHPFHDHRSSSSAKGRMRKAAEAQYRTEHENRRAESLIQIQSQLVPPCLSTHCNHSIPTIGSFSSKSSSTPNFSNTNTTNQNQDASLPPPPTTSSVLQYMPNYKPIRLSAFMSDKYRNYFSSEEQWNILRLSILQPALTAWSDALHTIPVRNNLTMDTSQLLQYYNYPQYSNNDTHGSTTYSTTTATSFTSFSSYFCGSNPLSNQPIPQQHISHGVPHTDTVLYVTLGFASDWPYHATSSSSTTTNNNNKNNNKNKKIKATQSYSTNTLHTSDATSTGKSQKDLNFATLVKNETELYHLSSQKYTNAYNTKDYYDSDIRHNTTERQSNMSFTMDNHNMISTTKITLSTNDTGSSTNNSNNVTASSTIPSLPTCAFATNILASAEFCNTDQFDRPTVGVIHLCISQDWFQSNDSVEYAAKTVVHEIGHVMGFNSISMAYLRHPIDGSPRTPRDSSGNVPLSPCSNSTYSTTNTIDSTQVLSSSSSSSNNIGTSSTKMIPLPSEDTLRFTTRRNGVRVAEIITETVAMIARNQFNCPSLSGAELDSPMITAAAATTVTTTVQSNEADFTTENTCFGSHWSRRLFPSDIMNPVVDQPVSTTSYNTNKFNASNRTLSHYLWMFSPLTMAYFIDTGWYRVNPARISNLQHGWGRGAGCEFVDQPCVNPTTGFISTLNEPFYCNQPNIDYAVVHGCTEDLSHKAVCELVNYGPKSTGNAKNINNTDSSSTDTTTTIPEKFQYFDNDMGDAFTLKFLAAMQMKSYNTPQGHESKDDSSRKTKNHIWGGVDSDAEYCPYYRGFSNGLCNSLDTAKVLRTNEVEDFGNNSRCVVAYAASQMTGLCMPIACVVSDRSLRIQVDGIWTKCHYAGEIIRLSWWIDASYIVCPDPVRTCPTFWCLQNCLGSTNGVCDYTTGQCMCPVDIGNVTTTSPNNLSAGPNNITMLPCDVEPYDTIWNTSNHRRGDGPDGSQFIRMELSLSQYYVTDSAVLSNKKTSLFRSLLRLFARLTPVELALVILAFVLTIATMFGLVSFCFRCQRVQPCLQVLRRKLTKTNQKSAPDDDKNGDDHNNKRICETEQNVIVPALRLWWLRVCVTLGLGNHIRQDPRSVTPISENVNTVDSSTVIRSISRLAANETTSIDDISDEQASERRINVVEIVDRTIDEDEKET